jgi:hypothetical protein
MHILYQLVNQIPYELQRKFIADTVDVTIRGLFPDKYAGLCYLYAILGSNLLSIVYQRQYFPIAGIALIDSGKGRMIRMLDNTAFLRGEGGAFHCWIESEGNGTKELIDFTFKHNKKFAKSNGLKWHKKKSSQYLWGPKTEICHTLPDNDLPKLLPDGKVWYNDTEEGQEWLRRHLSKYNIQYVKLTSLVLQHLQTEVERYLRNQYSQET